MECSVWVRLFTIALESAVHSHCMIRGQSRRSLPWKLAGWHTLGRGILAPQPPVPDNCNDMQKRSRRFMGLLEVGPRTPRFFIRVVNAAHEIRLVAAIAVYHHRR